MTVFFYYVTTCSLVTNVPGEPCAVTLRAEENVKMETDSYTISMITCTKFTLTESHKLILT